MKIKKIVLDLNGKEISLTIEQAKGLRDKLNELFGKNTVYVPQPYPTIYEKLPWWNEPDIIYCSGTSTECKIKV